ncbi:MAG TPA: hypothetical protein VGD03_00775 [Frankiaceae bacterium]
MATTALLGPSAAVVPLGRSGTADPWLVTALCLAAVVLGAAGLLAGLGRLRRGLPVPSAGRLFAGGLLATALLAGLAPVGSADVLSYAAYGRAVATGADAYTASPARVLPEVEAPWRQTPSDYGPLATAEQGFADVVARAAGGGGARAGARGTVAALAGLGALAFAAVAAGLDRLTRHDAAARTRAHLLWTANPLLLLQLVAGVHLDVLVAGASLAAVVLAGRRPASAGLALGAAVALKVTGGLAAIGLGVQRLLRPHPARELARLAVPALALAGVAYALAGPHVLDQIHEASRFTSAGSPWRAVRSALSAVAGAGTARAVVGAAALLVTAALAVRLARTLPGPSSPHGDGARAALAVTLAWLFAAGYQLAWYDALGFVLLPLLAASAYDRLLVVHCAVLSAAYLPGRVVPLPGALQTSLDVLRAGICPAVVLGVLVLAAVATGRPAANAPETIVTP